MTNEPKPSMSTRDTLLAFSEWLDSEGLIVGDQERTVVGSPAVADQRTHEELAEAFIAHWEADERGAILAGRALPLLVVKIKAGVQAAFDAMEQ